METITTTTPMLLINCSKPMVKKKTKQKKDIMYGETKIRMIPNFSLETT